MYELNDIISTIVSTSNEVCKNLPSSRSPGIYMSKKIKNIFGIDGIVLKDGGYLPIIVDDALIEAIVDRSSFASSIVICLPESQNEHR